ncbi:MAG: HAD family phosphatase [Candidatus Sericytochromatia bacterium]
MGLINTIIFDFDGLLADSEPIYLKCNRKYLEEIGVKNYAIEDKLFGMRAEEAFTVIKNEYNLTQDITEMIKKRNAYMIADFRAGELKMMPFAIDSIHKLSKKYTLAIGSSSKKELLDEALAFYDLNSFFQVIVSGDDVINGKPEPDIYLKVANLLNKKPDECIVLEDSPHGISAGKKAKMISIAIPNDQTKTLKFYDKPDYILNNLGELENFISNI